MLLHSVVLSVFATAQTQETAPDSAYHALRARAEQPAQPDSRAVQGVGAGSRLFHMVGGDNAECIRSIPDVTGDGRDEIVVGIGESGTDNVFCLDGASSGAATVVWSIETADGVSGGSCYGDQSIVPVSDTETDGQANMLLGTAWGGRTAYDLDSLAGAEAWKLDTYLESASGWVYSLCEISDVTGDGVPEYAFGAGSDNNALYLLDGASTGQATVLWKYAAGDAVYSVRNLGDVNADGTDDVLAAVGDDIDRIVCLEGDSAAPGGTVLWSYNPGTSVFACGTMEDVTGDGVAEALAVLWTSGGSAIRCLDGTDGSLVWSSTDVSTFGMMVDELEDVTADGKPEVIVSSWDNAVYVLDGDDGALVWKTTVGTLNGGDVWTARAIDDLNGDGTQDVIAGSFDYHVYAMDGETGAIFWAFNTGNRVFSVHPAGDLNGDGVPEVLAGTQDTTSNTVVHVLDGRADIPYPGLSLIGDGAIGAPFALEITGPAGSIALPIYSESTGSFTFAALIGSLDLGLPVTLLPSGVIPPKGDFELSGTVPNDPGLIGTTFYVQGLVYTTPPLSGEFTANVESITVQ